MRKPNRTAALVLATIVAFPVFNVLNGSASADPNVNEDRTDSETYTEARADYWEARAEYYARKAATKAAKEAGQDVPQDEGGEASPFAPLPTVPAFPSIDSPIEALARLSAPVAPTTTTTTTAPKPPPSAPVSEGVPTNAQLAALRMCESTDRYWINTGNGYYGAYQFSAITWWWIGYSGYPHEAPPAVQDQAARDLYAIFGWTPWPACSRYLGFR